ncbi:MAG: hypothetical protein FWC41_06825, partial [Firmicutes bacterium]|nr:hypothetical protein [Bacillota bacterium]
MQIKKIGTKTFYTYENSKYLSGWILGKYSNVETAQYLGFVGFVGSDFQHQNMCSIINDKNRLQNKNGEEITSDNLILASIFFAVRKVIPADWLNDRDQFLYPSDSWQQDTEFHSDCLCYSLFHGSNNIQSQYGINHWIPFRENEVDAKSYFDSHFMTDFISGKIEVSSIGNVFSPSKKMNQPLQFSKEAQKVFDCGRELWKYYHQQ